MTSGFASGWTSYSAKRRWKRTTTIYAGSSTSPVPILSRHSGALKTRCWAMEQNANYWNKGLAYLDGH
jgi:hypothetical protein